MRTNLQTYVNPTTLYIFITAIITTLLFIFAGHTLIPFLISLLFAYLCNPLVCKLIKKGIPRWLAAILVFSSMFVGIGTLVLLTIPVIQTQFSTLVASIPDVYATVVNKLNWLIHYLGVEDTVNPAAVQKMVRDNFSQPGGLVLWIWNTTVKSGKAVFSGVIDIILVPFLTYYLLRDWDLVTEKFYEMIPHHKQQNIGKLISDCQKNLSAFLRGQLLVVLCMSIFYAVTFTLSGLKVGIVLGIIMGLLTFLPYIGSIIGLVIAALVALAQTGGLSPLIWVLLSYAIGHFLENFYLDPKLIGNKIGLHPVLVILVILLGGTLFGFWGILLALPVTSVGIVIYRYYLDHEPTLS